MNLSETLLAALLALAGVLLGLAGAGLGYLVRSRREDHLRFVDIKRERYAEFLRLVSEHIRELEAQHAVSAELLNDRATEHDVPSLGPTSPMDLLAWERYLLAPAVGDSAARLYAALVEADAALAYTAERPYVSEDVFEQTMGSARRSRSYFLNTAMRDLGTTSAEHKRQVNEAFKARRPPGIDKLPDSRR